MQRTNQNIAAVLQLLAETWPKCFSVYEKRRRPLKVGIHQDILAALAGAITPAELSRALRCYVGNKVYRSRLVAGAVRVGLDGQPAGEVTARQAASPAVTAPRLAAPPPKRISLGDLRRAAELRKAQQGAAR
jgi:ProP effector